MKPPCIAYRNIALSSIEEPADESTESSTQLAQTLAGSLQAEVLVSDDADAMKTVADALGLEQQLCCAHVNRNIHDQVASLGTKALEHPDRVPAGTEPSVSELIDDLQQFEALLKGLPHDGQQPPERGRGRGCRQKLCWFALGGQLHIIRAMGEGPVASTRGG